MKIWDLNNVRLTTWNLCTRTIWSYLGLKNSWYKQNFTYNWKICDAPAAWSFFGDIAWLRTHDLVGKMKGSRDYFNPSFPIRHKDRVHDWKIITMEIKSKLISRFFQERSMNINLACIQSVQKKIWYVKYFIIATGASL